MVTDTRKRLRVISADRGTLLMDVGASSRTRLLRPSSDARRLVTISITSELAEPMLWDLERYRLVGPVEGHAGRVFTARFVFVGGRSEILTTGSDGTARRWDAETGRLHQSFRGGSHVLVDVALSPDGSVVVAGGSDGFLRFWDTSDGRLLWNLQAHRSYVVGVHYDGDDLVTRGLAGEVARWALPSPDKIIDACLGLSGACSSTMTEK